MMRRAVLLVGLALCGAGWGGEMEWMRRGTIYLDVNAASELQVTYRDGAAAEGYLYVFGPDGNALAREPVPIGMTAATVALDAGPGTYRAVVTGGNPWRAEAPGARIVFEPEREWTSLHQADDVQRRYYFRVPEGTERFTLSATNQNGEVGTPGLVRLRDPRGEVAIALDLQRIDRSSFMQAIGATSRAEAEVKYRILTQTHTVERPAPGLWSVEAGCRGCADDVGFWLDGVPNLFAASPEDWFEPTFPPTAVSITVDATQVVGPTGKPAAIASFVKQPEQVLALLRELGMTAITDYCGQDYREPSNDDADPMHLNWPGFNFAPADGRMEYLRESGLTTLTHIYGRAPEWLGAVGSDQWMANLDEVAEFTAAYIYHYVVDRGLDMEYFTFINEPNLAFSAHEDAKRRYIASCVAAGRRVKALQHPRLAGVKFGGPDIVIGETPSPCWAWVADLLDAADEYLDFVSYDVYSYGLLDDTWRYAEDLALVDRMIREHDRDGQVEEVLIFETNLKGGLYLQSWRQDTHYSAVWWSSVLANTLGTGRVSAVTYFTMIEYGARRKGLLTDELRRKPVFYAMQLHNHHLGQQVVMAGADHAQVDCLATMDPEARRLSLFVTNHSRRELAPAQVSVRMPAQFGDRLRLVRHRFTEDDATPVVAAQEEATAADGRLALQAALPPMSVWLFELSATAGDGD